MNMPRVLVIGDSISVGYIEPLRKVLEGKAEVFRPEGNCESTIEGLSRLDRWLEPGPWDIIHFNWGLHDIKYLGPAGENLADPQAPGTKLKVSPERYAENLTILVDRLTTTGAVLIWCTTTPVPHGAKGRVPGDEAKRNAIAAGIMRNRGIEIDDLYNFALPRLSTIQEPENVHFTDEGSALLAEEVARSILKAVERVNEGR
jgi:acyl-CoA thioesterase-1